MKRTTRKQPTQAEKQHPKRDWEGTLSATCCAWQETHGLEVSVVLLGASGIALFVLAITAPVYLSALGLGSLVAFLKGMDPFPAEVFADPVVWVPLFGTSAFSGLLFLLLAWQKRIVGFTFNSESQQLEYREKRGFFQPVVRRIPFESIVEVVPTLRTTYGAAGHFQVTARLSRFDERSLWLGSDIPLEDLTKHGEWLSSHLGERLRPVLRLDD